VELDPSLFGRITSNLLSNAHKYTPPGGQIEVKLTLDNTHLTFSVSDNGIGIPAEELPWLFEPYHRASVAIDSSTPGSGLGLAITKALVELMGGTISVESTIGVGSKFTVTLPVEVSRESISD
jgi:signal transduction histidine kinase